MPYEGPEAAEDMAKDLRGVVRALWRGVIGYDQAYDQLEDVVRKHFGLAWEEGALAAGIDPDELTPAEKQERARITAKQIGFVGGLLAMILRNSREEGGKLGPLIDHTHRLWAKRYVDVVQKAKVYAGNDVKYRWTLHPAEHCTSCVALAGKVKRASYWKRVGLEPNSSRLECVQSAGGIPVCKCTLDETTMPVSPGPLPSI